MKVGYARIHGDEPSLAHQEALLLRAGCEQFFTDEDSDLSGPGDGLRDCLAALKPGDILITTRLDCPAHSLANLVELLDTLARRGIGFRSLREGIDTTSPEGAFFSDVTGILADFQRSLTSEKTRAGMAVARAQGQHVGRPRSLDDAQIAAARREIDKGASPSEVAARLDIHPRTLQRLLRAAPRMPGQGSPFAGMAGSRFVES